MFNLPSNFISSSTAWSALFVNDLKPILMVVFGIAIAFIIVEALVDFFRQREEKQ